MQSLLKSHLGELPNKRQKKHHEEVESSPGKPDVDRLELVEVMSYFLP